MDKKALYNLSYGLFCVTAEDGGFKNGFISNTVMQITSTPLKIILGVNKQNKTHDMIANSGKFNVSILSEKCTMDIIKRFGFQSGRDVNKFDGFEDFKLSENGLPYLTKGANSVLSCKVTSSIDVGTHTLFFAEVTDTEVLNDEKSLTYAYYQSTLKNSGTKSEDKPKTENSSGKHHWKCTICGYIYEGDSLPEDFVCPLCKHGAEYFEQID